MTRGKTGWIRLAVASAATAAGLAALLAGAAFGLQAVTLPRPSVNQLLAAKTLHWLTAQHAIKSTAFVRGERVSSICVNATIGPLHAYPKRLHASLWVTGSRLLLIVNPRTFAPVAVRIPRLRTGWSYLARAKRHDLARAERRLSPRLRLIVKEEA